MQLKPSNKLVSLKMLKCCNGFIEFNYYSLYIPPAKKLKIVIDINVDNGIMKLVYNSAWNLMYSNALNSARSLNYQMSRLIYMIGP